MDKPILKDSMKLFEPLGNIKSRSMFGGFGIFSGDIMFALVVKNELHIRADDKKAKLFTEQGMSPYVYHKRGFPVVTKYFALNEAQWQSSDSIFELAQEALTQARADKAHQQREQVDRLKDLPNLRLGTERMLKKAGIESVEALKQHGSLEAFKAIRAFNEEVTVELLWALEGAIEGKHWSVIPQSRREELLAHLN